MARKRLNIPEEVKIKIRQHLSESYLNAIDGYDSASEEVDTLTGDLGASLRIKNQKVIVDNNQDKRPGTWTWSINYHKFNVFCNIIFTIMCVIFINNMSF